jgi:large subunit ribosomal protein L1
MMVKFGKLGKVLGPKGLMPNPKTGGVSMDIVKSIKEIKSGRIEFKNDKNGIVHNCIGKKSFDDQKIIENFNSFINALIKARPSSVKGNFIKSISISSTMGPGFYIDYSY